MTTSNRLLNRLVLFIVGLALAAITAGLLMIALSQPVRDAVVRFSRHQGPTLVSQLSPASGTAWNNTEALRPLYLIIAACLLIVVLALILALAHGHGRTKTLLTDRSRDEGPSGEVQIATAFAEDVLENALAVRGDLLDVTVTAYRHRSHTALKVRALPRSGVSPRTVVEAVRHEVAALDELLGTRLPVLLEIASSARANLSKEERVA
ncbi:hypothetical protein [Rathayibacter toxicus]|uniref:hypothetical protein n=1 Tax=Rathayibacter toxicus TaxID=145458 RepID=UPI001C048CEE|nr:hypothetical protein [Rathayibacter toxicus]QWL30933.1 hypothetical protein E2R34_09390 [Rathayibacter toxicus]